MLILIVGITGNLGTKLLSALTKRGHAVRGLARNKSSLSQAQLESLESFHQSASWYDVEAIRASLRGVDAVICAYRALPVLALEGHLLIVRLMEEQGIKRFVPAIWNLDWTLLPSGANPYYDVLRAFRYQVTISSTIEPLYIFVGFLAEAFFAVPNHGGFTPARHGVWDMQGDNVFADVYGSGDEKWQVTTEHDTAEFTAELVTDLTKEAGDYRFMSFEASTKEVAAIYERETGRPVKLVKKGTIQDLERDAEQAKKEFGLQRYREWMGYYYQLHSLNGMTKMKKLDNEMYPAVKTTSLAEFVKSNTGI